MGELSSRRRGSFLGVRGEEEDDVTPFPEEGDCFCRETFRAGNKDSLVCSATFSFLDPAGASCRAKDGAEEDASFVLKGDTCRGAVEGDATAPPLFGTESE